MNLDYAVERLYYTGWSPPLTSGNASSEEPYDSLPDGRRFPAVAAIQREFERSRLDLSIQHNLMFDTYLAEWEPRSGCNIADAAAHGMVVGSSETEAAVYALAHLRESRGASTIAMT